MQTGTIKWYTDAKGFGFIEQETGPDVFFHVSAVPDSMPDRLEGLKVRFEIKPSRKPGRVQADNIELVT
jgi:CspA family cold shock protein